MSHNARVQLEMGGKNPLVVLDDCDLDRAVQCALDGAFFATGQRCTASSRIIVTQGIHDKFVEALAARVTALKVGDALAPDTQMGPLASAAQLETTLSYVDIATKEGGRRVIGGEALKLDNARLLRLARADRRHEAGHAHQLRRSVRPGRLHRARQGLRRSARRRQRRRVRPVRRHHDHLAQVRPPLRAQRARGHGHDQSADRGRRLPRAVRRHAQVQLRPARAGFAAVEFYTQIKTSYTWA